MLYPLFDQNCELIGWMDPGRHIFDTDMNWIAYLSSNHTWSAETGNWLGILRSSQHRPSDLC
ncbi:4-fold beta flower protein [Pseudomonas monteilii]|uniref:4-fold beta flower protein n=1 Tax=Pseudomonas monteilii TaxID=76759 RepID=UPI003AF329C3